MIKKSENGPEFKLKQKVGELPKELDEQTLNMAEKAIDGLKDEFIKAMDSEVEQLVTIASEIMKNEEGRQENIDKLYNISHDLKGQAGTFNFNLITLICRLLCQFIEKSEKPLKNKDLEIIKIHVDFVKIVFQKNITGYGGKMEDEILTALEGAVARLNS